MLGKSESMLSWYKIECTRQICAEAAQRLSRLKGALNLCLQKKPELCWFATRHEPKCLHIHVWCQNPQQLFGPDTGPSSIQHTENHNWPVTANCLCALVFGKNTDNAIENCRRPRRLTKFDSMKQIQKALSPGDWQFQEVTWWYAVNSTCSMWPIPLERSSPFCDTNGLQIKSQPGHISLKEGSDPGPSGLINLSKHTPRRFPVLQKLLMQGLGVRKQLMLSKNITRRDIKAWRNLEHHIINDFNIKRLTIMRPSKKTTIKDWGIKMNLMCSPISRKNCKRFLIDQKIHAVSLRFLQILKDALHALVKLRLKKLASLFQVPLLKMLKIAFEGLKDRGGQRSTRRPNW